ncbi:MAG: tetratricopeptide repeat protein, partial [Longimicrobiales bacterium]
VLTGLVVACDGEPRTQTPEREMVLAQATPAPVSEPVTSTVDTAPAKPVNVSYKDAEVVFRKGHYEEASQLFASYVENKPNDGFGHYMLGLSSWKSGDRGRAEQALLRAVELDSENVKVRTNLARVLLEEGRAGDALPHIEKATELKPESFEVWRVLGNVKGELGRSEEALDAYRKALVLNEKDGWSMNNYGLVLIKQGRYEEALPALALAVEVTPGSPVFQNNLGIVLEQMGRLGGASQSFESAVKSDSTYTKAKISLERVQKRLGNVTVEPLDLSEYSRSFAQEIQRWRTPNPLNDDAR